VSKLICGVVVTALKVLPNEKGRLMEVQRADDPEFPGFGQVYVTQSHANVVKAWYRHRVQVDQIAVITGHIRLVLFDDRPDSSTQGAVNDLIIGELAPQLVLIPPGVWHGFKAIGDQGAFLLHLNNKPFRSEAPDEEKRPANDASIPYSW
jgi:dTDP-4-dehydrorhamnose 3,5-epimerase